MKINTAAIGIVKRVCQQMIKIHNHRQHHDQPRLLPSMSKQQKRCSTGNQKMKGNMKGRVKHGFEQTGRGQMVFCGVPACFHCIYAGLIKVHQAVKRINTLAS